MLALQAFIYWNPAREAFYIPWIGYPIVWYSLFLATGCLIAYFMVSFQLQARLKNPPSFDDSASKQILKNPNLQHPDLQKLDFKKESRSFADLISWYVILGMIIGARLGEVFFYDFDYYCRYPLQIFYTWHGGLASHGGVLGILAALFLAKLHLKRQGLALSYLELLDLIALPSPLVAAFIRLGNFFNQEIIGYPTDLPWGVVFLNPLDGGPLVPRHPAQLYEALFYFSLFILLILTYRKYCQKLQTGALFAWVIFSIFTFRFFIEFLKMPQETNYSAESALNMGQILSLPLILISASLIWHLKKTR